MARLLALVVLLVIAACGPAPGPSPTPSPVSPLESAAASPPATAPSPSVVPVPSESATPGASAVGAEDPLIVISLRGGECPTGTCESATVIERSGRVHQTAPEPMELGTARPDILEALVLAIDAADFDAIRSVPFTGECPVNFDGQEQIFEFHTDDGVERIASCETEVDPAHPLFATVQALLDNLPSG